MSKAKVTTVGDRVKLTKDNLVGVVRFVGEIQGKKGVFFGVELDNAKGKNNGSFNKVPYFKCKKNKGKFVKQAGIAKTNPKNNADALRITVGDKVKCKKQKCNGTVRFIGTPYSVKDEGVFYGVELDKPKGKNNGTVKDRWYFTCKDKFGAFCAASGIAALGADKGDKKAKKDDAKEDKKAKKDDAKEDKKGKKKGTKKKGTKKKIEKPKPKKEEEKKEDIVYKVGDRVMIKPDKKGQIKYMGETKEFGSGVHYGIRLTEKRGDCDGEWKDVRKFQCPEGFGIYVPLRYLVKPVEGDFDFMNEEEKYEEEAKAKAEEYQKEKEKLGRLRAKFNEVDTDGSQTIDREEFKKLAKDVFECTSTEANALFKVVDVNDSGKISFAEFDNWIEKIGGIDKVEDAEDTKEEAPKEPEEAPTEEDKDEPKEKDAPKEEEEPPKEEEEAPKEEEVPKEEEEAPKEEEEVPKEEEEAPKEEEEAPKEDEDVKEDAPKEEDEAPKAEEEDAPKDEEAPKEEDDAPKEDEEAPKEDDEAPKEDDAPKEEEEAPKEEAKEENEDGGGDADANADVDADAADDNNDDGDKDKAEEAAADAPKDDAN